METTEKNNHLNTLGIVTVGVVGAVFTYVSIIALQALYVSETSPMATMKAFGAQGALKDSLKAEQVGSLGDVGRRKAVYGPNNTQLLVVGIDAAKQLVIRDGGDPSRLVPGFGPSNKASIAPMFGRPQPLPTPGATPPAVDPALAPVVDPAVDPATGPAAVDPVTGAPVTAAGASGQPATTTTGTGGPAGPNAAGQPGTGIGSGDPAGTVNTQPVPTAPGATTTPAPAAPTGATSTAPGR